MKTTKLLTIALIYQLVICNLYSQAQNIGINTTGAVPNTSAVLDVDAAPANNKGLLIPRIPLSATNSNVPIGASIATSLLVYNTATAGLTPNNVTPGYYYWDGTAWVRLLNTGNTSGMDWNLLGNAGTIDGTHFIGTTDNVPFNIRVNNQKAGRIDPAGTVFLGYQAGNVNTTGIFNTGIGHLSLSNNTTGGFNTGIGHLSLSNNTTGNLNIAVGGQSLSNNTTGSRNTAIGYNSGLSVNAAFDNVAVGFKSLFSNFSGNGNVAVGSLSINSLLSGDNNIAIGWLSLAGISSGSNNIAIGNQAIGNTINTVNDLIAIGSFSLNQNTTGTFNTAVGHSSLSGNTSGSQNTALGFESLQSNTTGSDNTAVGLQALRVNTTGSNNTATGNKALQNNTVGKFNTANGFEALLNNISADKNTAIGFSALKFNNTGFQNTAVGYQSLINNTGGDDNTAIGMDALGSNSSGNRNTAVGSSALFFNAGSDNTAIGNGALIGNITGSFYTGVGNTASIPDAFTNTIALAANSNLGFGLSATNKVRIGNASIISIGGQVGWTTLSDARVKNKVQENVVGLNFIMALRPVTYHYDIDKENELLGSAKTEDIEGKYNIEQIQFSGFLAQEVEAAAKKVGYDFSGIDKPQNEQDYYALRYAEFVVPLVKAMQEQQAIIDKQQEEMNELLKRIILLEKK